MKLTKHAEVRLQQRAIPPLVIDLLARYGREHSTPDGTVLFFDARGRKRVRQVLSDTLARFDKIADAYLVEADDDHAVVTVGHRTRRLKRKR